MGDEKITVNPKANPVPEKLPGNLDGQTECPTCPVNLKWLRSMLELFPLGAGGKLERYRGCIGEPKREPSRESHESHE